MERHRWLSIHDDRKEGRFLFKQKGGKKRAFLSGRGENKVAKAKKG